MALPLLWLDLAAAGLVSLTGVLALLALMGPGARGQGALDHRLARMGVLAGQAGSKPGDAGADEARAREALQRALAELEAAQARDQRRALVRLLRASGTERSPGRHLAISAGVAAGLGLMFLVVMPWPAAVVLGLVAGLALPVLHLRYLADRRTAAFAGDLPGALDLIVRGIRAGLPLHECIRMASDEWNDPLKSEFVQITNDLGMGLTIREAVNRFADNVGVTEARLFAIVIAIQAQSGGNLSEVLSNLSELLREKAKLQGKIRALTSEARASAWIIGAIPLVLTGAVALFSPQFLAPLFTTSTGNLVLYASGAWMATGVVVMRAMMRMDL